MKSGHRASAPGGDPPAGIAATVATPGCLLAMHRAIATLSFAWGCAMVPGGEPTDLAPDDPAPPLTVAPARPEAPRADDGAPTRPGADVWSLTPDDVLLQLELVPTFAVVVLEDPTKPFGRIPQLTLYRDGTVIYTMAGPGGHMEALIYRMRAEQAQRHVEHVLELGFTDVHSHEQSCRSTANGRQCISHAFVRVLRVRMPDGALREIRNYAGWAKGRQAVLDAIYERTEQLALPPSHDEVLPYAARAATLFGRAATDEDHGDARDGAMPWPLSRARFAQIDQPRTVVVALDPQEVGRLTHVTFSTSPVQVWFRRGTRRVVVTMVLWLPGVDHRPAIAGGRPSATDRARR